MNPYTVIIICGPTAVGKTAVAISLAIALRTEIISADSRQCFTELNIGVAKPSAAELLSVPHHFINSHSIHDEVNASVFEHFALARVNEIFKKNAVAIMVGGTGLYIKAFCDGMDEMPTVDAAIRQLVVEHYEQGGLAGLQKMVAEKDPAFWAVAERDNPQRLMRGLEVMLSCGKSITSFRRGVKKQRDFNIIKIGLELPREQLYAQINGRVDNMIEQGLLNEVKALLPHRNLNALQTVGYRELFDAIVGDISIQEGIRLIKSNTRHYAKRQLTWFKRDPEICWLNPHKDVTAPILQQIAKFNPQLASATKLW